MSSILGPLLPTLSYSSHSIIVLKPCNASKIMQIRLFLSKYIGPGGLIIIIIVDTHQNNRFTLTIGRPQFMNTPQGLDN